jgi:hypothetical protein
MSEAFGNRADSQVRNVATRAADASLVSDTVSGETFEVVLERRFSKALHDSARITEFNAVVCAFTQTLKDQGEPIERVLVRLKQIIAHARSVTTHPRSHRADLDAADGLSVAAVRLCIEHFYKRPAKGTSWEREGETDASR